MTLITAPGDFEKPEYLPFTDLFSLEPPHYKRAWLSIWRWEDGDGDWKGENGTSRLILWVAFFIISLNTIIILTITTTCSTLQGSIPARFHLQLASSRLDTLGRRRMRGGCDGKDDDGDDIDGNEGGSDVIIFSPELVVGESPADVVSRSGCPSQFQPEMEIMMKVWKYKI